MADPVGHRKRTIISEYDPLIASENEKKMSLLVYLKYKRGGLTGGKKRGVYFVRKNLRKTNPKN